MIPDIVLEITPHKILISPLNFTDIILFLFLMPV